MQRVNTGLLALAVAAGLATAAHGEAVLGGYALAYADADYAFQPPGTSDGRYSASGDLIAASADQGPGARTQSQSESGAWRNRLDIASTATDPRSIVIGSALSFFAVNQVLTGDAGARPTVSYTFDIDGVFTPGNNLHYPGIQFAPAQNLTFFLLAYSGRAISNSVVTDNLGTYIDFVSTNGHTTLGRTAGAIDENAPFLIGAATACFGADTRCRTGGAFDDSRTISFAIGVDQDYFIIGYLASNTNGNSAFFNTAKLQTIDLAPEFGLVSDDGGALKRLGNGSFALAVPEPTTWLMLVVGFGSVGRALRSKGARAPTAVGVAA